jgi:hypothetical protein
VGLGLWLGPVSLQLNNNVFEARGVPGAAGLSKEQIAARFTVKVDGAGDVPSLAGDYDANGTVIRFHPRFPLEPGVSYRAMYRAESGAPVTAVFRIPKKAVDSTTRVEHVYPSARELPANQLKLYIQFSAPMSRAEASRRIHLLDDQGKEVPLPFLEIEEELWDPQVRRLTVLFDPGRIKRGLVPHNEVGPALVPGHAYQLVVDREWPDAQGAPLVSEYRKAFRVREDDRTPPVLENWKLTAKADAVAVDFPEPLDAALLQHMLWIEDSQGRRMEGGIELQREETRWIFHPERPLPGGEYRLRVGTVLEDLAGNRIGRPFDVDTFDRVEMRLVTKTEEIPFKVAP